MNILLWKAPYLLPFCGMFLWCLSVPELIQMINTSNFLGKIEIMYANMSDYEFIGIDNLWFVNIEG